LQQLRLVPGQGEEAKKGTAVSATLRFQIGNNAEACLMVAFPQLWEDLPLEAILYWRGIRPGSRPCWEATFKLPEQVGLAFRLYEAATDLCCGTGSGLAKISFRSLQSKLRVCLGLPDYEPIVPERDFLATLASRPGDLTAWLVYADWLEEQGGNLGKRAERIRGWSGKKRLKTKYGVIVGEGD
jgi:uncharacterized protein (TIGR02996 family)